MKMDSTFLIKFTVQLENEIIIDQDLIKEMKFELRDKEKDKIINLSSYSVVISENMYNLSFSFFWI
jgi:hypothetical protein